MWIAVVSGGAAILGTGVTAIFSYFVAKKAAETQQQIETKRLYATIVTTERLRWLQDIRQRLSHLYTHLDMQYNHLKRPIQPEQQSNAQTGFDKFSMEIMKQTNNITLMLAPIDPNQGKLAQSLQDKQAFLLKCFAQRSGGEVRFDDQQYATLKLYQCLVTPTSPAICICYKPVMLKTGNKNIVMLSPELELRDY